MERIELLIKEYDTLRDESLGSMSHRSQIVSFGLASLCLLLGTLFGSSIVAGSSFLRLALAGIGIPALSIGVLLLWLGEVERMVRAGNCLAQLEILINAEVLGTEAESRPALQFETWLRSPGVQMRYPYVVVPTLFLGAAVGAPLLTLFADPPIDLSANAITPIACAWLAGIYLAMRYIRSRAALIPMIGSTTNMSGARYRPLESAVAQLGQQSAPLVGAVEKDRPTVEGVANAR